MKTLVLMLMLASIGLSAADAAPAKDSAPPAAVNKELLQLLQSRVNLKVSGMGAVVALRWQLQLTDIPLKIEATQTATAQKVDFALEDATLAEALRKLSQKTGVQYRLTPGTIRMAMADEWKKIDAGTVRFEELLAK